MRICPHDIDDVNFGDNLFSEIHCGVIVSSGHLDCLFAICVGDPEEGRWFNYPRENEVSYFAITENLNTAPSFSHEQAEKLAGCLRFGDDNDFDIYEVRRTNCGGLIPC